MDDNKTKPKRFRWWLLPIILCVFGLLAVVVVNLYYALSTPASNACVNNLRQMDASKQQWAVENSKTNNEVPTWNDINPYLGRGSGGSLSQVFCPDDKTRNCTNSYEIGDLKTLPRCKINPSHVLP